jgi:hypothetical protein
VGHLTEDADVNVRLGGPWMGARNSVAHGGEQGGTARGEALQANDARAAAEVQGHGFRKRGLAESADELPAQGHLIDDGHGGDIEKGDVVDGVGETAAASNGFCRGMERAWGEGAYGLGLAGVCEVEGGFGQVNHGFALGVRDGNVYANHSRWQVNGLRQSREGKDGKTKQRHAATAEQNEWVHCASREGMASYEKT